MKVFMWQILVLILWICACDSIPSKPLIRARLSEAYSKYPLALKALFGVSIRLQVFLEDDFTSNFIVSPLSATVVAAQLMLGTRGEFRNQLANLLSIEDIENHQNLQLNIYNANRNTTLDLPFASLHAQLGSLLTDLEDKSMAQPRNFKLQQKSAIFYNNEIVFKKSFKMLLKKFYSTQWFEMDVKSEPVKAMTLINNWAKKNTNGLIKRILQSPPSPKTSSIFANAIYFFAEWKMPFNEEMNRNGLFNASLTKQVPVTYMINNYDELPYAETETYQMISLPYLNDELGMYILLPKLNTKYAYDMKSFVKSLDPDSVFRTIDSARPHGVVLKMPKMALSHSFSIMEQLKKFYAFRHQNPTMKNNIRKQIDSFNNFTVSRFDLNKDLYLTDATDIGNLRIDDIVQQVVLNVNERGTEAGVATFSTVDYMGGQKNFLLDRPFVFFIQHEYTKATLFWGTIVNPTA